MSTWLSGKQVRFFDTANFMFECENGSSVVVITSGNRFSHMRHAPNIEDTARATDQVMRLRAMHVNTSPNQVQCLRTLRTRLQSSHLWWSHEGLAGLQPTVIASRAPHLLLEQSVMIQKIADVCEELWLERGSGQNYAVAFAWSPQAFLLNQKLEKHCIGRSVNLLAV